MNQLQISANDGRHFFEVALFDTVAKAKADVASYGGPDEFNAIVVGRIFHAPPADGCLGRIVFSSQDFAPSIIQHELLHAAMLYERNVYDNAALSFADIEAEERLAYTQQALLDELLFALDEAGLQDFGVDLAEEPQAAGGGFVLDDSNSTLLPDGSRLYPKSKPAVTAKNQSIIADTKARLVEH